jgi:pimeloyl-ACP methyl ester carboxylesterase
VWSDSTATVTGRYYRVRHDAEGRPLVKPFPRESLFGSSTWLDKNFILEQPNVGEVITAPKKWNNGAPPVAFPDAIVAGSVDCIINGESVLSGLPIDSPDRYEGWPLACFILRPVDDWGRLADVYVCRVQRFWADRLKELDVGNVIALESALALAFPGGAVNVFFNEPLFPPLFTVVHDEYAVIGFAATQDGETALLEVIEGILGPTNIGPYSTTILWQNQADRGNTALSIEGVNPKSPILCVGHSYGGAAAEVLAGMYRVADPGRVIRYLTFGAPRPGDGRLIDLLGLPTRGVAMANTGDLIASIPPSLVDIIPAQVILGVNIRAWAQWQPPRETWSQEPDGLISPDAYPVIDTPSLIALIQHVWATFSFFAYEAHTLDAYRARIRKRCPDDTDCAHLLLEVGGDLLLEALPGVLCLEDDS